MIFIGITLIVIGSLAALASLATVFWIFKRDSEILPSQSWSPSQRFNGLNISAEIQSCSVGHETVRYWDLPAGSGDIAARTLVFFHGIGAWSYVWRDLIPLINLQSRLVIVDLPGFGMSSKNRESIYNLDEQTHTLIEFLEKLNLAAPILVGSSMGGTLALWIAKKWKQKVGGVIAISPSTNGMRYWMPFYIPLFAVRFLAFVATRFLFRLIMKNVISSHDRINDELINEYWRPFAADPESAVTFIKGLKVVHDPRLPYELKGLSERVPICILWGEKDRVTPVRDNKLLARYLPKAKFFLHATSGHHVMEDAPDWCAEQIHNFMQTIL